MQVIRITNDMMGRGSRQACVAVIVMEAAGRVYT